MDQAEQREAMRTLIRTWARVEALTRQAMPGAPEKEIGRTAAAAMTKILRLG